MSDAVAPAAPVTKDESARKLGLPAAIALFLRRRDAG
jgi:hypothetical protein